MKINVVTGGCGFVGRNLVKKLLTISDNYILIVDDLSSGRPPSDWLGFSKEREEGGFSFFQEKIIFIQSDIRQVLQEWEQVIQKLEKCLNKKLFIDQVFHFAAIVGGRIKIENDPLAIATDLSIDAIFFHWASKFRPVNILYPSSSAAYPIVYQTRENHLPLSEDMVDLEEIKKPDLTYGWAKITGEYLAGIAASKYKLNVTCIRPFSGYGEDQDLNYPIPAIAKRIANRENPVEVWGDGLQSRDFIHIDDVIEGIFVAMEIIHDGSAINLGTGKNVNFLEVIKLMAKLEGYSPEIALRKDMPIGVFARYSDMALAKSKLSWEPKISLEEGFSRVLKAQRQ